MRHYPTRRRELRRQRKPGPRSSLYLERPGVRGLTPGNKRHLAGALPMQRTLRLTAMKVQQINRLAMVTAGFTLVLGVAIATPARADVVYGGRAFVGSV